MLDLETLYTVILGGGGLAVALAAILKFGQAYILTPVIHAIEELIDDRIVPVSEKLEDIEADVADIRHEVNTNSGQSLKDVASKTRTEVAVLAGRFEDHLHQHGSTP